MISFSLLTAHLWGDYVLQSDRMAARKLKCAGVRAAHVTVYTASFVIFSLKYGRTWPVRFRFLALVWLTHFLVDSFRFQLGSTWPFKPLLVDQTLHLTTLALLVNVLNGGTK